MFKQYSIKELSEHMAYEAKYDLTMRLIDKIKQCVNENDIKSYYPKNLFKDNGEFKYFLFTDCKIIICSAIYDDKQDIIYNFKGISRTQITSIELLSDNYDVATLSIHLANGEDITLDNKKDTNTHHSRKFIDLIKEIFKELL